MPRSGGLAGAGGPQVLLTHADGQPESLETSGVPLAILEDAEYEEFQVGLQPRDRLLLFSDGAIEVSDAAGKLLGLDGLLGLLRRQGYPANDVRMEALEADLLKYSDAIRLTDDLTFVDILIRDV